LFREDLYHRLNVIRLRLPSLRERREDIPLLIRHFLAQSAKQLGVEAKRMSDGAMQFLSGLDLPGNVRQLENLCNWITVMAPGQTVEVKDLPPELTQSAMQGLTQPSPMAGSSSMSSMSSASSVSTAPPSISPAVAEMPRQAASNVNGAYIRPEPLTSVGNGGASDKESWIALLESEAAHMLAAGQPEVMDALGRQFESALIKTALKHTHGRKNDAAVRLGIGRNTITRKIHELGIDGAKDD
jgi:two-component system, NtrC family, nitrogen regulation response regulator GlnG